MGLATLLLAAALSLTATPIQNKQAGLDRDKDVKPSKEQIAKVVEKVKALRSRAEVRHNAPRRCRFGSTWFNAPTEASVIISA